MILGSFIDAGLEVEDLRAMLQSLPISGYEIVVTDVIKKGISAKHLDVKLTEKQPCRHLHHIRAIIEQGHIPSQVKELSLKIFHKLAEAEAKVHGTTPEKIHFHEVGAVDAVVDIVGAAYGVYRLGIKRVYCSPLNTGKGTVKCAHGFMPIPAPATAELLRGAVTYSNEITGELVTPTGAAVITALTSNFGGQPLMKIEKVSYGAGTWDLNIPNVLRLTLGQENTNENTDQSMVIETNIDDMNPEFYDYLMERLFAAGAVDVYFTPVQMKKNRPGTLVSVTSNLIDHSPLIDILMRETTSLGLRMYPAQRVKLIKEYQKVQTPWGEMTVKIGSHNGQIYNLKPEYEDCKKAARETGLPIKEIWQKTLDAFKREDK